MKFAAVLKQALVAALIAGASAPAFSADDNSWDPSKAGDGKKVYTSYCARCHGLNMAVSGNSFFDLRKLTKDDKPRFLNSVRNGLRAMPAWGDNIKPEEYEVLWSYIMTTNTKK